ncbi:hypothetical protein BJV77DRAFT_98238 [Russula vinacea]|nr:hypothetical protein BJV77DRAFT_98238 [Russula vinacea]
MILVWVKQISQLWLTTLVNHDGASRAENDVAVVKQSGWTVRSERWMMDRSQRTKKHITKSNHVFDRRTRARSSTPRTPESLRIVPASSYLRYSASLSW